ncbi:hypothetical protein Goshw_030109, partial [Gossypium schwendimanii]|nr:hypothetical protein [Gossypium schwendimanii]
MKVRLRWKVGWYHCILIWNDGWLLGNLQDRGLVWIGVVFTSGEVKNSGGGEIGYCSGEIINNGGVCVWI